MRRATNQRNSVSTFRWGEHVDARQQIIRCHGDAHRYQMLPLRVERKTEEALVAENILYR